jgi:hypothetical protein
MASFVRAKRAPRSSTADTGWLTGVSIVVPSAILVQPPGAVQESDWASSRVSREDIA